MKATFPVKDCGTMHEMFKEIGETVEKHLGFFPPQFVLILTDGKNAQTLFAGDDLSHMTRLLVEGTQNHLAKKQKKWGLQ